MKVVLLGTAGYHPSDQRQTSCLFLPALGVAFDAGTSFYRVRDRLVTPTLDIYLTHAHLDHSVGLTFLLNVLHGRPAKRVTVYGAAEKLASLREHLFHPDLFPVRIELEWRALEAEQRLPDGARVQFWEQQHPGGSLGYRVDGPGYSFALVTDTTADPQAPYVERIRGVDVLIHECNFADGQESLAARTGHSCAGPVAQVAQRAGVGRLVLTHFDPLEQEVELALDVDRLRTIFPRIELASDNQEIDL